MATTVTHQAVPRQSDHPGSNGTLVAVGSPTEISDAYVRLRLMGQWIANIDNGEQLAAATEQLREVREWMRIKKVSADLRLQAMRLECTALRRIGLLDQTSALPPHSRSTAKNFASLDDAAFDDLLTQAEIPTGPKGVWNIHEANRKARFEYDTGRAFGRGEKEGEPSEPFFRPDSFDLATAAKRILSSLENEEDPFTVNEAAVNLAAKLGPYVDSELDQDPDFMQGLSEVIRGAIRAEVGGVTQGLDHPRFVTYHDADRGWLRIPWGSANLDQLRNMTKARREQVKQLGKAADRLEALLSRLELVANDQLDVTNVDQLAQLAESAVAA